MPGTAEPLHRLALVLGTHALFSPDPCGLSRLRIGIWSHAIFIHGRHSMSIKDATGILPLVASTHFVLGHIRAMQAWSHQE